MKRYNWVWMLLMLGCSDNLTIAPDQYYFPIHVNQYWDYAVNETDILQTNTCADGGQTIKVYQLRMLVSDSIKNSAGGYTFIIHRYTRPDNTQSWSDLDTWTARISTNSVIQTEGNTSYVKFVFPFGDSAKWNGNQYNDLPVQNYYATLVGKAFSFNAANYSKTITVFQSNYDDFFISRDIRKEVYAYNIGLVYKKIDQRTFFLDPCYGQQKIQKGLILEQSLIAYGKL